MRISDLIEAVLVVIFYVPIAISIFIYISEFKNIKSTWDKFITLPILITVSVMPLVNFLCLILIAYWCYGDGKASDKKVLK